MKASRWITALIDIDRSSEFTGDDVDRFSELIDLGADYEFITIFIPTIVSGTTGPYVQRDADVDTVPVIVHILDDDATGSFAHATTAAETANVIIFRIGGIQYLRIKCDANQTSDVTLYVRGFNRD